MASLAPLAPMAPRRGPARLGLLGGTFDPVHAGHVAAAAGVARALALDEVLLVVAARPWQKAERVVAPAEHRLAMAALAAEGVEGLAASDLELRRPGETYTVDTLEALAAEDPGRDLFLVVGDDVAGELATWYRPEAVRRLATLVVVDRPGAEPAARDGVVAGLEAGGWQVVRVPVATVDVSSSDVRRRLGEGQPVDGLVPAPVIAYIAEHGLYAGSG